MRAAPPARRRRRRSARARAGRPGRVPATGRGRPGPDLARRFPLLPSPAEPGRRSRAAGGVPLSVSAWKRGERAPPPGSAPPASVPGARPWRGAEATSGGGGSGRAAGRARWTVPVGRPRGRRGVACRASRGFCGGRRFSGAVAEPRRCSGGGEPGKRGRAPAAVQGGGVRRHRAAGARVRLRRDAPLPPRASEQAGSIRVPSKRGGRGRRGRARPCLRAKTVPSPGAWAGSEASKVRFPGRSGARAPRPCRSGFFLSTPPPTFSVCARTVSRGEALVVPSVRAPGVGRAGGRRAGPSSEKRGRSWRAVPALPRARGRCRKADNS